MGQSASQPKEISEPFSKPKSNLADLTNAELEWLLSQPSPLTMDDIRMVVRSLKESQPKHHHHHHDNGGGEENGHKHHHSHPPHGPSSPPKHPTTTTTTSSTTTSAPSPFYSETADSVETNLAIRLHQLSPTLAQLRFQMVPARIQEPVFWQATLTLLKERLADRLGHQQQSQQPQNDEPEPTTTHEATTSSSSSPLRKDYVSSLTHPEDETDEDDDESYEYETTDDDDDVSSSSSSSTVYFQDLLAAKEVEIEQLKRQIQELQQQLLSSSSSTTTNGGGGTTSTTTTTTTFSNTTHSQNHHSGTWIPNQDSQDFWQYPEEVKENMRKEKQKRLRQVHQDMKFILDSDAVEDSNGHWSCCGQEEYRSTEPCNSNSSTKN